MIRIIVYSIKKLGSEKPPLSILLPSSLKLGLIMQKIIRKGRCPTGAQGSPSELNFLRLMEELNPEPFDHQLFEITRTDRQEIIKNLGAQVLENPVQNYAFNEFVKRI
jgi:hypothetical protein